MSYFADQNNKEARDLEADMLEQMGYQAENATWRNFYLQGTKELREGIASPGPKKSSPTIIAAMTTSMIFDALAAKIIGPRVGGAKIVMNWKFTDPDDPYLVRVQDGVLNYTEGKTDDEADVTLEMTRDTLNKMMAGELSPKVAIVTGRLKITGNLKALLHFLLLLDDADPSFPIVTPRSDSKTAWSGADKIEDLLEKTDEVLMDHPAVAQARDFIGELPRGC
jgi:alkyl sulfatase BDS1-like metallo-beta-lactamase superfamily hydrolase